MLLQCSIQNTFHLHGTQLEQQFSKMVKKRSPQSVSNILHFIENDQVSSSLHTFILRKTLYAKLEISVNAQNVTGVSSQSP